MNYLDLGLCPYEKALVLQIECVEKKQEAVLICEHPEVITVGRASGAASDVHTTSANIVSVDRGGRATLHLPGQVVVYPIVNLKSRGWDQVQWLRVLEEVIVNVLADFRISAATVVGKTGVWVGGKKIASLGIAVRNDMSYHGLALNVCCDLQKFNLIKPCGFDSRVMTSMKEQLGEVYVREWKLNDVGLLNRVRLRFHEVLDEVL